jgi:hypothetical protein
VGSASYRSAHFTANGIVTVGRDNHRAYYLVPLRLKRASLPLRGLAPSCR